MLTDRAITTTATPATLRATPGQSVVRYVFVLSLGAVFRWAPNATQADDGFVAIVPVTGGYQGAWLRVRPQSSVTGAPVALANGDQHINVGLGLWFTLAAATLSAAHSVTLDVTNAQAGDEMDFTRYDMTVYGLTLINGGPAAGNVRVMPSGSSFVTAYFNGTDWLHKRSAQLLP